MQYETIILELLSRVQSLETEVATIKRELQTLRASDEGNTSSLETQSSNSNTIGSHQRMTDDMVMICYKCGKKLNSGANLSDLVSEIEAESGMNRNSAIMYLYAVSAMLNGTVYKRALSTRATKMYFDMIFNEYGSRGLRKALQATALHIQYRKELGHTVESIEDLYNQYMNHL